MCGPKFCSMNYSSEADEYNKQVYGIEKKDYSEPVGVAEVGALRKSRSPGRIRPGPFAGLSLSVQYEFRPRGTDRSPLRVPVWENPHI
jgi:hypothetical protein